MDAHVAHSDRGGNMRFGKIAAVMMAAAFLWTAGTVDAEAQYYRPNDNKRENQKIIAAAVGTIAVVGIIVLLATSGDDDEDEGKAKLSLAPVPVPEANGRVAPMLYARFRF